MYIQPTFRIVSVESTLSFAISCPDNKLRLFVYDELLYKNPRGPAPRFKLGWKIKI